MLKTKFHKNHKRPARVLAGVLVAALGACSTAPVMQSAHLAQNAAYSARAETGIIYALPKGLVTVQATWTGKQGELPSISILDPQLVPDTSARFSLATKHDAFSHDDLDLSLSNGLLTTVNAKTEDQTKQVVTALVDIAIETQKAEAARNRTALNGAKQANEGQPFSITVSFDPFDKKSLAQAAHKLSHNGLRLKVGDADGKTLGPIAPSARAQVETCTASLCYRVPIAAQISVRWHRNTHATATKTLLLPDPRLIGGYNVTRAPCIPKTTGLTFTGGMLTGLDVDKPSEVVGCLSIPLDIIKKIVGIPSVLFETETGRLKAESELVKAQTTLLTSQAGLIEQQNKATSP